MFNTRATSVAHDSIQAYLMLDGDMFEMQRTPLLTNRWEVLAPVPAGKDNINYRFKVNYQWKDLGGRKENSKLSDVYNLQIGE